MRSKNKIYFLPKTKIGRISFWIVIVCFIGIYLQYWIAMATKSSILLFFGVSFMDALVTCGIISIVAIVKYRDYAILLFLSALIGIMGILFVLGEFLVPH